MGVHTAPAHDSASNRKRPRIKGDQGAVLVEFALLAPLFFLLLFAILEFGWTFGQFLDVRHAARESSRMAAVNFGQDELPAVSDQAQTDLIVQQTCERMSMVEATDARVRISYVDGPYTSGGDERRQGDYAQVEVQADLRQLTGFLDFALDGVTLESQVETRIERGAGVPQTATYFDTGGTFQDCP